MAPNNALAELKRSRKLRKSATPAKTTPPPGATTVLDAGTVEDRGAGISVGDASGAANEAEVVAREIASFLRSDARLGLRSEIRAFFTVWTWNVTGANGPATASLPTCICFEQLRWPRRGGGAGADAVPRGALEGGAHKHECARGSRRR